MRTRRVGGTRRRAVFGLTTVVMAGVLALFVGAAIGSAPPNNVIGDPSAFEANDGNMTLETTGALDWNCLANPAATANCGTPNTSYTHDQDVLAGTAGATGDLGWKSGQKQDVVCPVIVHGSNPGKDTFTDVASYNDVGLSSQTNQVDTFLYGATIRQTANGTANQNIELQHGTGGTCAGEPSGVNLFKRVAGDKLIEINYNGSATPGFTVSTWLAPNSSGSCQAGGSPGASGCWSTTSSPGASFATGAVNGSPISAAANGMQVGDAISPTDPNGGPQLLVTNQFAEFGIDLTGAGVVSQTACSGFAQTVWESRSAVSFSSNPEDIEIEPHTFSTCQPAAINVVKVDSLTGNAIQGAVFTVSGPGLTAPLPTCTTDVNGDCTLGPIQPVVTGTAPFTYTVSETTAPNGYTAGGDQTCKITFTQTAQTGQNAACVLTFNDTPVPGAINIHKEDTAHNAIQGAVFTLYTDDGSTVTGGDSATNPDSDDTIAPAADATSVTCTTDAGGNCSFQQVKLGTYTVFETATPIGYETANAQTATVGLGSTPGTGQTVTLPTFTDPYAPATIKIVKKTASGSALSGAGFTLYQGASTSGTVLGTCTTDSNGGCTLGDVNISEGTPVNGVSQFTVAETTTPNGYATAATQTFGVIWTMGAQTVTKTFTDTPVPGTITIQKNDANGKALAGAVFGLYTDSGSPVSGGDSTINPDSDDTPVVSGSINVTCTTNAAGQCSFMNVPLGPYVVFETATPSGYQTAPAQTATVGLGSAPNTGATVSLTFTDPFAPADVSIIKQDPSGNAVAGAGFTLYQGGSASGTVLGTCTTDSTGDCDLGNVNVSEGTTFTVAETTTPNGYATAASQTITVVWTNSPQTVPVTFTDVPVPGTINVQKFDDASPANALNGATFTLYKETGSEPTGDSATVPDTDDAPVTIGGNAATCTTAGGVCSIATVPIGTYVLFETTTPAGYQTAPAQDVTIGLGPSANTGATKTLTFTDPRLHKEIVVVCSEGTNTLDSSDVTIDGGSTQQSLDTGVTLPTGVTEAKLCGLGGATKSDLPDGASSSVQVTVH